MPRLFTRFISSLHKNIKVQNPIKRPTFRNASNQQAEQPGQGKGPITWKSLTIVGIGGAGILGFVYYVKQEKEMGLLINNYVKTVESS